MKHATLIVIAMFIYCNICVSQSNKDLDSFFTHYFKKEILKNFNIIIEIDSCIFTNSSTYDLAKVIKAQDLKYKDYDKKHIRFVRFIGFRNVYLEPNVLNYYLSFEILFKKRKVNNIYESELFTFLIEKNNEFSLIYIDALKPILIFKFDIINESMLLCLENN